MTITTSPLTATQGYLAPQPSPNVTIGGPACDKRFATTWADAQIASETRSTRKQGKLRSHPSSQTQKQCCSRRLQWTSSLSCHSRMGSILYSRLPTTTAPRQPSSSHATRRLQPKEWLNYTFSTCSNGSCKVPTGRLSDLDTRGCLSGSTTTKCIML
jgi:hypothetical protein